MRTGVLFTKLLTAFVVILVATIALGQATAPSTTNLPPKPAETSASPATGSAPADSSDISVPRDLTIGIGDLLKISVLGAPEYDQDVRVAGSGEIVIGLVGRVHVAGQTTEQAQALIRKRLMDGGYFADPQVSVFEKEFATQGVSVLGEVQKPGVYPITGPRRLFDVLSLAGGTTPKAGVDPLVVIVRVTGPADTGLGGTNPQLAPEGRPEHARATVPLNPPCAPTVRAYEALLPADTV